MAYTWTVDGSTNRTTGTYTAADTTTVLNWSFWTTNPLPTGGTVRQLVVLAPGGGFQTADQTSDDGMGRYFVAAGYQSLALSYRAGDTGAPYPAAVNDIPLGIASIITANDADPLWIDKTLKYVMFGTSAGGTIVLSVVAANPTPYACVATWSPVTDFTTVNSQPSNSPSTIAAANTRYTGDDATVRGLASPALHIPKNMPPVRVINESLELMPYQQAHELYSACGVSGIPCTERIIPGTTHGILIVNDTDPIDGVAEHTATTNWVTANKTGPTTPFTTLRGFGHL